MDLDGDYIRTVFPTQTLEPGRFVTLEVSDTGCGMSPEVLARIFDPFFTTKTSGRGLGLSAMMGIVKGHRGGIKIYSEPGRGSSFKLFFPASRLELPDVSASKSETGELLSGTVLLVDDEEAVRESTGTALRSAGLQVLLAEDGQAAVEFFEAHPNEIDLVVMDLTMPRMNGLEGYSRMRRIRPDVRVILCSGYNEKNNDLESLEGLAGFLQKPYPLKDLRALIRSCLR